MRSQCAGKSTVLSVAAFFLASCLSMNAPAQTVYEPWDYSNLSLAQGADIVGQTGTGSFGFDASATSWSLGLQNGNPSSGSATYSTQSLSYLGPNFNQLNTAGGAATIAAAEGDTLFTRALETAITRPGQGEPTDDFWVSFLVRVDSADGGTAGDAFWSTDNAWNRGAVGVQGGDLRFVNGPVSEVPTGIGTTHFMAVRLRRPPIGTTLDPTVDQGFLFVNPALDSEPNPADGLLFNNSTGTVGNEDTGRIRDAVNAVFKLNATNNGVYTFDEFRIGDSYASVAPFTATDTQRIARYTFPSLSEGMIDRASDDSEPLTMASNATGGADPADTSAGLVISGDDFNEISTSSAFANNDFVEFTIGIDQATSMSLEQLSFSIDLESTESVFDWEIRSSTDGFASNNISVASGDFDGLSPGTVRVDTDLEGVASLQGATTDLTFRIAFANALADIGAGNSATLTLIDLIGTVEGDAGQLGDYDGDDDVDGADFLAWQRGESPNGAAAGDLQDWQDNYGQGTSALGSVAAIPEPLSFQLLAVLSWALISVRGRNVEPRNPMC